jgi:hypothetical protein
MSILVLRSSVAAEEGLTAEQDWINRSTAEGVVYATDFRNTAVDVTPWISPHTDSQHITKITSDSITGDGCLQIATPAGMDDHQGAWVHPLNSAWVTDQQGFGTTEWFMQVRLKLAPNRLTCGSNGGGFKLFNIGECRPQNLSSSRSHPNGEIVLTSYATYDLIPWLYRDIDFSQDPLSVAYGGGGDLLMQPEWDNGDHIVDDDERFCIWRSALLDIGPGCLRWPVDEWFTLDLAVKIVGAGSGNAHPDNRLRLWITRAGSQTRRPLWDAQGFEIGADEALPLGLNGVHALAFDTARTGASEDTWQRWGQLVIGTQMHAVPLV